MTTKKRTKKVVQISGLQTVKKLTETHVQVNDTNSDSIKNQARGNVVLVSKAVVNDFKRAFNAFVTQSERKDKDSQLIPPYVENQSGQFYLVTATRLIMLATDNSMSTRTVKRCLDRLKKDSELSNAVDTGVVIDWEANQRFQVKILINPNIFQLFEEEVPTKHSEKPPPSNNGHIDSNKLDKLAKRLNSKYSSNYNRKSK